MFKQRYLITFLCILIWGCEHQPESWEGEILEQPRTKLLVSDLLKGDAQELLDMSFFAQPSWASPAKESFSGTISLSEAVLNFPKAKEYYPGENLFPSFPIGFTSYQNKLIPLQQQKISTKPNGSSYWDVVVGTGKIWHEEGDGAWDRASFPLTLTDRWVGQARNCVATFVYQKDSISPVCVQCSQETADIDDQQLGNISGMLPATFLPQKNEDSAIIIENFQKRQASKIPILPLKKLDQSGRIASYFDTFRSTNAPTSLGAIYHDGRIYLHPPKTRQGNYPYPEEMRHGLYSVTKSMAGALALLYFAERYGEAIFDELITDYVPALATKEEWKGVTFSHTLNMVTGTNGGEDAARLFETLIAPKTAEAAIAKIAELGDAPPLPGEKFHYASTNLFVLSYALQQYVSQKENSEESYWKLVEENVLKPMQAENFSVLHTIEEPGKTAIPILAYGALPNLDEAAKIALLFANEGRYKDRQLLNKDKVKQIFSKNEWPGYATSGDYRGSHYRHSFWSKKITSQKCAFDVTYMLGFGENYIVFLPNDVILFRFLDEHDLDIDELIQETAAVTNICK